MSEYADRAQELHTELVGGDPTASARLAELVIPVVVAHLKFRYRGQEEHLCIEAASDAVMDYLLDPLRYDPSKSKLLTYLRITADGDMLNLLAKRDRRERRFDPTDPVELSEFDGNKEIEGNDDPVLEEVHGAAAREALEAFIQENFESALDRELALLVLDDVRKTAEYVAVLNLDGMDEVSQRAEVKRHKDRIKAKLKRAQRARQDGD